MGNIEAKQRKFSLIARNQGGVGEILLPSAAASFRKLPPPAACGGFVVFGFSPQALLVIFSGRKMEGGGY